MALGKGFYDWYDTGDEAGFGAAATGVVLSWVAGMAAVAVATFFGAPIIVVVTAAAVAAGAGSALGETAWKWISAGRDWVVDWLVNENYRRATTWRPRDPLAIDLDGDGIETRNPTFGPVLFDHNGDGVRTGTGWLAGDDAWLVMDRNGNGLIDSGSELFGVDTDIPATDTYGNVFTRKARTGFEALGAQDSNGDGVFDANDATFGDVRLWRDLNGDGISQANELQTLAQHGIKSISLEVTQGNTDLGNGNSITGKATVIRQDGGKTEIDSVSVSGESAANLNLEDNPFYREFTDKIPLTEAASKSAEMRGSGWTRDLREAMSIQTAEGAALQGEVSSFAALTTRDQQLSAMDALVEKWAASTGRFAGSTSLRVLVTTITPIDGVTELVTTTLGEPSTYLDVDGAMIPCLAFVLPDKYYSVFRPELLDSGYEVLRRMSVLEVFNGSRFINSTETRNVNSGSGSGSGSGGGGGGGAAAPKGLTVVAKMTLAQDQVDSINQAYESLVESVFGALVSQTRLQPYLDSLQVVFDESGGFRFDASPVVALLDQRAGADAWAAMGDLVDLMRYSSGPLDYAGFNGLSVMRSWIDALPADSEIRARLGELGVVSSSATSGSARSDFFLGEAAGETFDGGAGDDYIDGAAGSDVLIGGDGRDHLYGGSGNDRLRGDAGDDVLEGGAGDDSLSGGAGNDVYRFGRGDGQDYIEQDYDASATRNNRLSFKPGVAPGDVTVHRDGTSLVIRINGTNDQITVGYFFFNDDPSSVFNPLQQIDFADGTVWSIAQILEKYQTGTAESDNITGTVYADVIRGNGGNDTLYGSGGNDQLFGGDGDDKLYGGDGDDVIEGGAGYDNLGGGGGNDTYVFGRGDGQDYIQSEYNTGNALNVLSFKEGIDPVDVVVARSSSALTLTITGTTDQVVVESFFLSYDPTNAYSPIQQVKFANGTVWSIEDLKQAVSAGTAGPDSLIGTEGNDVIDGRGGNDTLYGNGGNDQLLGSDGNDFLSGGDGDDVLDGGAGDDVLGGGSGNDTYLFGRGDGQDYLQSDYNPGNALNVLSFKAGVAPSDVVVGRSGGALTLTIAGTTDQITVASFFDYDNPANAYNPVQQVTFADGTVWSVAQIVEKYLAGSTGSDNISGTVNADVIRGNGGNDTLYGNGSNDQLFGGEGSDTLGGGDGDDVLDGGAGDDVLGGGSGNDTYLFGRGDGQDYIQSKYDSSTSKLNVLQMKDGISSNDLTAIRSGDSLVIGIDGTTDQLTVSAFFYNSGSPDNIYNPLQQIRFADGTAWSTTDIENKVNGLPVSGTSSTQQANTARQADALVAAMASFSASSTVTNAAMPSYTHGADHLIAVSAR